MRSRSRIDAEHFDVDFLAFLQHVFRMIDAAICHFRDVQQPFDAAADVDEGTEVRQAPYDARNDLALFQLREGPLLGLPPVLPRAAPCETGRRCGAGDPAR